MNRVIETTDDLGNGITHTTSREYDLAGRVAASVDEEGNETTYEYDALSRLVKTTDAPGNTVERTYDTLGNLIQVQYPNQGITFFDYDKNNRLTKIIRPMLEETAYEYDALGNRTAMVDTKGQRIEYTYNAVNRLTQMVTYAAGDHTTPVKTVTFDYDALGRITGYDDGTTGGSYAYDDLGRKTSETVDYGAFTKTLTTGYYANGLKSSFSLPDSDAVTYAYDENNRLVAVGIPGQGQITTTYDAEHWNRPASVLRPGGSRVSYTYDPIMQVTAMVAKDPAENIVMSRGREYSDAGTVKTVDTEHGQYTYRYDSLYRLVEADNPTLDDEAYTYDGLGNRLTSSNTAGTWSYNANNQLLGYDTTSFAYDGNGNLTARIVDAGTSTYVYDEEDRMVRVEDTSGNTTAEYYYDPFGRRLWKDVDGVRTCYLYSDEGLVAEYDAAGTELRQYGWNPGSTWGTDPLFLKQNGSYYWYQNDGRGAPQQLIAGNGSVVWSGAYDAFGNCQVQVEGVVNNLRLPGQYFDVETGLHYNLNRYYDPTLGRYLRVDPLGDGLNLYAYCFNNPVGLIDPLGLCAVKNGWDWWSGVAITTWEFWRQPLYTAYTRIIGPSLRVLGGITEVSIGFVFATATSPTIIGTAAGAALMVHGADQILAGIYDAYTGTYTDSYTSSLLQSAGMERSTANLVDAWIGVAGSAGMGAANLARASGTVVVANSASKSIPGRVQSRVNVRVGDGSKSSGLKYALGKHGGTGPANKSQFSISEGELKNLL